MSPDACVTYVVGLNPVETDNDLPQEDIGYGERAAGESRAHLPGVRHGRQRTQGLVLDLPRAPGDGDARTGQEGDSLTRFES